MSRKLSGCEGGVKSQTDNVEVRGNEGRDLEGDTKVKMRETETIKKEVSNECIGKEGTRKERNNEKRRRVEGEISERREGKGGSMKG